MSGPVPPRSEPPVGADTVWGNIATLVAGPVAWGAIGYGVDAATGSGIFLPVGLGVGFIAGLWLVLHRYRQTL